MEKQWRFRLLVGLADQTQLSLALSESFPGIDTRQYNADEAGSCIIEITLSGELRGTLEALVKNRNQYYQVSIAEINGTEEVAREASNAVAAE